MEFALLVETDGPRCTPGAEIEHGAVAIGVECFADVG